MGFDYFFPSPLFALSLSLPAYSSGRLTLPPSSPPLARALNTIIFMSSHFRHVNDDVPFGTVAGGCIFVHVQLVGVGGVRSLTCMMCVDGRPLCPLGVNIWTSPM